MARLNVRLLPGPAENGLDFFLRQKRKDQERAGTGPSQGFRFEDHLIKQFIGDANVPLPGESPEEFRAQASQTAAQRAFFPMVQRLF